MWQRCIKYFDGWFNNQNTFQSYVLPVEDDEQMRPQTTMREIHWYKNQTLLRLLNMEGSNYTNQFINLCSKIGTATQCLVMPKGHCPSQIYEKGGSSAVNIEVFPLYRPSDQADPDHCPRPDRSNRIIFEIF